VSGLDWRLFPREQRSDPPVPVINYVQSVRHAWAENPRRPLLVNKAIRICVSPEVTAALEETGEVRGPMFTIPAAIDHASLARIERPERDLDLLVVALKAPDLGRDLAGRLVRPGRSIEVVDRLIPRASLLDLLTRATVTLFLPYAVEGWPLPLLEGMALGTIVVCPDVVGNRSFCLDGENCFRREYTNDALLEATETALASSSELGAMIDRADQTARSYDLGPERTSFLDILGRVEEMWAGI
jgi:hypothetical protein